MRGVINLGVVAMISTAVGRVHLRILCITLLGGEMYVHTLTDSILPLRLCKYYVAQYKSLITHNVSKVVYGQSEPKNVRVLVVCVDVLSVGQPHNVSVQFLSH